MRRAEEFFEEELTYVPPWAMTSDAGYEALVHKMARAARAYASECVKAWREKVIGLVAVWERAYPEEIFRPVSEGEQGVSSDRIAAQQGRHMARSLQKALSALPGETP